MKGQRQFEARHTETGEVVERYTLREFRPHYWVLIGDEQRGHINLHVSILRELAEAILDELQREETNNE